MLAQVARVEVTVTASETEALLLEFNLIKQHKPRYNILLKDDKSFPFIHVSGHAYPRIAFYRGTRKLPGRFFGPYPNSIAARETLLLLQKLFRLRPCEDTFFANRSRPCLQYQIDRCTGPCVGLISRSNTRSTLPTPSRCSTAATSRSLPTSVSAWRRRHRNSRTSRRRACVIRSRC